MQPTPKWRLVTRVLGLLQLIRKADREGLSDLGFSDETIESTEETTREEFLGRIRLVDNVEDNPLQIFFPEIPSEAIRREPKSNGR
jgi:hypothetical protein